jgi:hypothetical protein
VREGGRQPGLGGIWERPSPNRWSYRMRP